VTPLLPLAYTRSQGFRRGETANPGIRTARLFDLHAALPTTFILSTGGTNDWQDMT